jgi:hypothetical protein
MNIMGTDLILINIIGSPLSLNFLLANFVFLSHRLHHVQSHDLLTRTNYPKSQIDLSRRKPLFQ